MPATGNADTSASDQRRLGHGRRPRAAAAPHGLPDPGVLAREAVIRFLRDASKATAEKQAERAVADVTDAGLIAGTGNRQTAAAVEPEAMPRIANSPADPDAGESDTWHLSAISAAALDRIEAAAAKVEADIAIAHRAYEELQAGAGAAAEAAVRAAGSAMASAGTAVEAERRVRISLRQVRQNVVITAVLVVVVIITLSVIGSIVH
jgi:hypothetical protein